MCDLHLVTPTNAIILAANGRIGAGILDGSARSRPESAGVVVTALERAVPSADPGDVGGHVVAERH